MRSASEAVTAWASVGAKTIAGLGPVLVLGPLRRDLAWSLHRRWATDVLARLGVEVRVEDRRAPADRARPGLYVHLNQQTLLSQLLYSVTLPPCPLVVNVEYAVLPLVGWASLALGGVPIVRQRPAQAKAALERVSGRLANGEVYGISIEGRRSNDGGLSPFKKGPVVVAIDAQCDLIPFMTHGEYALWPRGSWRVRPGRVDAIVYRPISTRGLTYADRDRLVAELRELAEAETARHRAT